jgi:molecular chaperone GrpE
MHRETDIAEAAERNRVQGAPAGAPEPSVPAGEPEAPATPVASVESENVAGPQGDGDAGNGGSAGGGAGGTAPGGGAGPDAGPGPEAGASAEDHERKLEQDLEQLAAKAEKADEYLELAQRTRADFENYRKRAAREAAAAQERGITKLAKELLPAVDNLDRALQAAQTAAPADSDTPAQPDNGTAATLVSGIKLVHDDVIAALARAGIERFSPEGERFDPQLHEAVAQIPAEGAESGTVVEVYQRGYRLGEVVLRPARVVVAA